MKLSIRLFLSGILLTHINQQALSDEDLAIPFRYAQGKVLYDLNCASCHGEKLTGSDNGPPLIHPFYKPSHHGDSAFYRAGLQGVRAHHWNFGDMPPVPGMTERKMKNIISYIRYYQQQMKLY